MTWAHTVKPRLLPGVQRGPGRVAHSDPRHTRSFPRNQLHRHTPRGIPRRLAHAVTSTAFCI